MPGDLGAGIGDELLGAVDHPFAVLEGGARPGVPGVAAGLGLGQPECRQLASGTQVGEVALFLRIRAEQENRLGAERGVRAHRDRDGGVHPGQLFDGDRVLERCTAGATDVLGERDAHPAECGHLRHQAVGERLPTVVLCGLGGDLLGREVADRLL